MPLNLLLEAHLRKENNALLHFLVTTFRRPSLPLNYPSSKFAKLLHGFACLG